MVRNRRIVPAIPSRHSMNANQKNTTREKRRQGQDTFHGSLTSKSTRDSARQKAPDQRRRPKNTAGIAGAWHRLRQATKANEERRGYLVFELRFQKDGSELA